MKGNRKPLSKKLRFTVFRRDGFKCLYCGATPVTQSLHVDHVIPVSKGGKDDLANLVTACAPCNLGKSNVSLDVAPKRPVLTDDDRERAQQIAEYMRVQTEIHQAQNAVGRSLAEYWTRAVGSSDPSLRVRLQRLSEVHDASTVMRWIDIVASRKGRYDGNDRGEYEDRVRYLYGVARNWDSSKEAR